MDWFQVSTTKVNHNIPDNIINLGKEKKQYSLFSKKSQPTASIKAAQKIKSTVKELNSVYKNISNEHKEILNNVIISLQEIVHDEWDAWEIAEKVCIFMEKQIMFYFVRNVEKVAIKVKQ